VNLRQRAAWIAQATDLTQLLAALLLQCGDVGAQRVQLANGYDVLVNCPRVLNDDERCEE
jgi:hypothetical protein